MRKFLVFLFLFIVAGGALLFFARDWIVKGALASAVRNLTGFETKVQTLRLDPFKGIVEIEGLLIQNPEQFEKRIFADAQEIYLSIDLPSLLKREHIRIYELKLNFRELNIEKDSQGVSNVSLLTAAAKPKKAAPSAPSAEKPKIPFYLDRMELTLRRVSYEDRSSLVPQKLSLDAGIEKEVFEGINDPASIVRIILLKAISKSPFGNLGLDPSQLQDTLTATMGKTLGLGGKLTEETLGTDVVSGTKETLGQAQDTAKEKITDLWGKLRSE